MSAESQPTTRRSCSTPMPAPTDLLDALDPEQRRVAEALRGPVRVLAGAGTGKTRAITHRIAYGVATGLYVPTEVLAVTFTTRAAGEMRGRLRGLGAGGVQARTFHSAALRQLRYFWPRVHGHDLPDLIESKIGLLAAGRPPAADQRRPGAAARPRQRDRVGQGQQRRARRLRPGRPRPQPLRLHPRPRHRRPDLRGLRGGQARPGPDGHGGRAALRRRPARRRGGGRGPGPPAVQVARRRRVPGRLARSSRRCSTSGWAVATSCAWSATPPRRSTPSPGANAAYLRDFTTKFPDATSIELVRNYRSTPEVVAAANHLLAGTPSKGVDLVAQRPSGSPVRYTRPRRRGRRGRGGRRPHRRPARRRHRRPARSPSCSASTPSPRRSRTRSPRGASRTSSAARPASSTGPRCARP